MILRQILSKKIKAEFPRIQKPLDYADVLLAGLKLKALDKLTARKHADFSEIMKVKNHAFTECQKNLGLLVKIEKGDRGGPSPMSNRETVVFKFDRAQVILNYEITLLLKHINSNEKVKKIITDILKIPLKSTINTIKITMNDGNIFKQGSRYDKIFYALLDNKIKSTGYLWFGIRLIPKPTYHLSKKSIGWINNIKREVN